MKKLLILLCTICSFSHGMCYDIDWSMPTTISTAMVNASEPRIVIDLNGNATAVWVENNGISIVIKASSQPAGMGWSSPVTLSGTGVSDPRLGIDSNGNVTAIWLENGVVSSSTLPLNGSWSAEKAVSVSGASSPALGCDPSGNAVAVWVRNGFVESSTQLFGGSWGTVTQLTTNTSSSPQVAIGANGTVVAVWHSVISGSDTIVSATSLINGTWNAAVNVAAGSPVNSCDFPKVAVDANGNATAIWLQYNLSNSLYENVSILAASLPVNSAIWSTPTPLISGGVTFNIANISTSVAVDTIGNAIACWSMSYNGSTYDIEASIKLLGRSWAFMRLQGEVLYTFQVDVATNNSLGNALTGYMLFDGVSSVLIKAQEFNLTSPKTIYFGKDLTISQGLVNGYPRVATSLNKDVINAAAIWMNSDGVNNRIAVSTGSKTTLLPPTNLAVVQNVNNFDIFTEYYNTISWTPSASPNIIKYNIYRNGVFIFGVDSSVSQVIDHLTVPNESVTYGVVAKDNCASFSPFVQVSFP